MRRRQDIHGQDRVSRDLAVTRLEDTRKNLEGRDHGIGPYRVGRSTWIDVRMREGCPVAWIWRDGARRTSVRLDGLAARLVAVKALAIAEPVDDLPAWCLEMKRTGPSPEAVLMGRAA